MLLHVGADEGGVGKMEVKAGAVRERRRGKRQTVEREWISCLQKPFDRGL